MEQRHILFQFKLLTPEGQGVAQRSVNGRAVHGDIVFFCVREVERPIGIIVPDVPIIGNCSKGKGQRRIDGIVCWVIEGIFRRHPASVGQIVADLTVMTFRELLNIESKVFVLHHNGAILSGYDRTCGISAIPTGLGRVCRGGHSERSR